MGNVQKQEINMYKIKLDKLNNIFFFIFANLLVTPFFFLIKFKGAVASIFIIFVSFFYATKTCKKISQIQILFILFFFVVLGIPGIYFVNINYYFMFNTYIASLLFIMFFKMDNIDDFLENQTNFFIILAIFSWIGFIYAFIGGKPLFKIPNPDGRLNSFYLSTFSNLQVGRFIRASGLYDEPGALSFFICITCLLRLYRNKNYKKTVFLMLLGMITLSVAHIIITSIVIAVCYMKYFKSKDKIIFFIICVILFIFLNYFFYDALNTLVYSRFKFSKSSGKFAGDTRTVQIAQLLKQLDGEKFIFGVDLRIQRSSEISQFGIIGENPLSQLFFNGVFVSIEYYFIQFVFLLCFIFVKNKRWVFLSVLLLWMQRPYFNIIGYSIYLLLFFFLGLKELKKSKTFKYLVGNVQNDGK